MIRSCPGLAALAGALLLLLAPPTAADEARWTFDGNSMRSTLDADDLTGSTAADNEPEVSTDSNDVHVGASGVCPSSSADDQLYLCDEVGGPAPNLDHFVEIEVECKQGRLVDPIAMRFLAGVTGEDRGGEISIFAKGGLGFDDYAEVDDSPQVVPDSAPLPFEVDLGSLPPAATHSFRLHPGKVDADLRDFSAFLDDLEIEADCVTGAGGKLTTSALRVTSTNPISKCSYVNASPDATVTVDAHLRDANGVTLAHRYDEELAPGEAGMIRNKLFAAFGGKRYCVLETDGDASHLRLEILVERYDGSPVSNASGR